MGNVPNGIRVYIDTSLLLASVGGPCVSVGGPCVSMLKSIALLMVDVHRYQYTFIAILKRLVDPLLTIIQDCKMQVSFDRKVNLSVDRLKTSSL